MGGVPKNGTPRRTEMSRKRLRLLADTGTMATAIQAGLRSGVPMVLTFAALRDLGRELGGPEKAAAWIMEQVKAAGKPLGVNIPTADGGSETVFYAPDGWTQERLAGWVGGMGETLEAEFGAVRTRK